MYRSDGTIVLDTVCKCENPKLKLLHIGNSQANLYIFAEIVVIILKAGRQNG